MRTSIWLLLSSAELCLLTVRYTFPFLKLFHFYPHHPPPYGILTFLSFAFPLVSRGGLSGSFLRTWPVHLQRCFVAMSSCCHLLRSLFEIVHVFGYNILRVLLGDFVRNVDSLVRPFSVICQHSDPYKRIGKMQLVYSASFVRVIYWLDFHTAYKFLDALLALDNFSLVSISASSSVVTVLPRYVNVLVDGRIWSFIMTGDGLSLFKVMTYVFLVLIFKLMYPAYLWSRLVLLCICWWEWAQGHIIYKVQVYKSWERVPFDAS